MKPSYNRISKQYAKCVICGKKFAQKKSNHVSCSKHCQYIKIKQSK